MSAPQLQNYIAGEWIAGASTSKDVNPSDTGDVIAEYAQADKTQTERAIEALARRFGNGAIEGKIRALVISAGG